MRCSFLLKCFCKKKNETLSRLYNIHVRKIVSISSKQDVHMYHDSRNAKIFHFSARNSYSYLKLCKFYLEDNNTVWSACKFCPPGRRHYLYGPQFILTVMFSKFRYNLSLNSSSALSVISILITQKESS